MSLFELPKENIKHLTFEWRGVGRGVDLLIFLFSEVTLFEYIVSKIPSLIVSLVIDLSFLDDHDMGEL